MAPLCYGQDFPLLQFEHLTVKDGLSSNVVNCITEDQLGFIWIGTTNGLNRYDGYRFKHYYHSNIDTNSLVNNNVQRLYTDTKGRLWMSTDGGVSCFLPSENRFVNFSALRKAPYALKINGSTGIYEDEEGSIWLSNQEDVIYRVLPDLTLQEVKLQRAAIFIQQAGPKRVMIKSSETEDDNEWAFKANRIYRINKITKQVEKTYYFPALLKYQVLRITQDRQRQYYVATWKNGIFRFYPERNELQSVSTLPDNVFIDISEWRYKQQDWIICLDATEGLNLVNPTDHAVTEV